ncbi:quinone reductase [Jaminaea rosea]|uniref:Quinone reductase n=1 Tax=Jaminaea rosea TaxID=1569628 RepID=A0A316UNG2_9BASI|nr:quinone reductase [Jaminaea rosea]PWN25901.1 quinone reductase [Jaminaea rosea]
MSLTHKAAFYNKVDGKADIQSRPNPLPEKGQVSVEITATSLNPVDWKIRAGAFPFTLPAVIGGDAAGVVHSVGKGVKNFKKGDRVFFQGYLGENDASTFQGKAVLDEKHISHTPSNVSDAEASGIQLASMVAVVGLYHESGALALRPCPWEEGGDKAGEGKAIVVLGGSSSVGQYVIQLCRLSGFSKIITTSSSTHSSHLQSLGAHTVLDRNTATPDQFIEAAAGIPLVAVYDSIGSDETYKLGVGLLQEANKEGQGQGASHYISVIPGTESQNFTNPDVTVRAVMGFNKHPDHEGICPPFIAAISGEDGWVGKGLYKPNRMEKIEGGLKGLDEGLDRLKEGVSGVKLWLDPRET